MDIKKLLDDAMQNILEAKREQGKEEKYTKATDKEDDGEGLDPVGKGDSDIDNDGDSDETDQYLKKRRAAIAKNMKEQIELEEADGWIAMYNGKKVEITKSDAKDLYSAKMYAAKELKVPKSKMGLLAIKPAYNESLEEASADEIRSGMPGFVGMDFAKKADDDDLVAMAKLKDERAKVFNNSLKPIDDQINKLRKKYRLKPIK